MGLYECSNRRDRMRNRITDEGQTKAMTATRNISQNRKYDAIASDTWTGVMETGLDISG